MLIQCRSVRWKFVRFASGDGNSKEPEHDKNGPQPHAGGASDNQNRHAGFHSVTFVLLASSRRALDERDHKRKHSHGSERPESNQGESPEWLWFRS